MLPPGTNIYASNFDLNTALEQSSQANSQEASPSSGAVHPLVSKLARSRSSLRTATIPGYNGIDSSLFASPSSIEDSPEFQVILPPKNVAVELFEAVWSNACVLFRFYHRPQFIRDVDLLYDVDPDDYTDREYKILPLVYSVVAVGLLFTHGSKDVHGFKDASEGYKYFVAARQLLDITDTRDLYAIKSVVMMIIFLQCSARLSTCYSYIGIALRSALRAGLHRKINRNFNPVELETRKRLFWTIRKMDIYVNAMLGLPRSIDEEEFDQELPVELDDENITEDGYFPQKEGKLSSVAISNSHTKLMEILHLIMKNIYPIRPKDGDQHINRIANGKIEEMEAEILTWHESLPPQLKPGANVAPEYMKANRLLSVAYCYVQIVLYRPFIHYCSPRFGIHTGDERPKLYARKCINVARRVMYLANDLVAKNMLHGAYWYSIYTIFFSVASLVYYVHENAMDGDTYGIRLDAEMGKNALKKFKESSQSAQRTYDILNFMFDQLNKSTAKISNDNNQLASVSLPGAADYHHKKDESQGGIITDENDNIMQIDPNYRPSLGASDDSASTKNMVDIGGPNNFDSSFTPSITGGDVAGSSLDGGKIADFDTSLYIPGMVDQFETQVFGRFLPPYMMTELFSNGHPNASVEDDKTNLERRDEEKGSLEPTESLPDAGAPLGDLGLGDSLGNSEFSTTEEAGSKKNNFPDNGLFNSKSWDDFLSQHVELSGVNI